MGAALARHHELFEEIVGQELVDVGRLAAALVSGCCAVVLDLWFQSVLGDPEQVVQRQPLVIDGGQNGVSIS
jgi:hypothetical protein